VTGRSPVAAASLAVGALLAISLYVAAFRPSTLRNVGWDAEGYVVQMRAASDGILDLPGTRPGVAVTGAFVAGSGLAPVGATPIILSVAAAASLGLAAAVALRRAWDVPGWGLGVAVLVVATWGGTARLSAGYLANLLSLTLFLVATTLAISSGAPWWAVGAAFAAALLAHPGLLPAYGAILIGWLLLDVALTRDRDRSHLRSVPAVGVYLAASLLVVAVVAGWLGVSLDELQDLAVARERFEERAAELLAWIDPVLTVAMVGAGAIVAVLRRNGARSRAASRLGIAWLAVSAGGLVVLALAPQIPGHRTLLLAVPAPILGALGFLGGARWAMERIRTTRSIGWPARLAIVVGVAAASIAVAVLALRPFDARAGRPIGSLGQGPEAVAGYLHVAQPRRPVVLVMDPLDGRELLAWKARLNAVRALAPDRILLEVVLYVGDERSLLDGRPTVRPGDERFEAISARTWPSVRVVLDEDPIVLVVRPWVAPEAWERTTDEAPVTDDDVAVLRGPVPSGDVAPVVAPRLPIFEAGMRIAALVVLLGLIGGGWSAAATAAGDVPAEAAGLAPAAGLAVVTLAGTVIGLVGGDPGGAPGLIAVGVAGIAGWLVMWRARMPLRC
jgi:hypothetical protein